MKQISLLILTASIFTACAPFTVGNVRIGNTPARKIAKDMSIPGKGVDGECLPYAIALHKRFQAAGIPSKIITFGYESLNTMPGAFSSAGNYSASRPFSGAHAVVAYVDGGRTYLMDNQSWMPRWVHGDSLTGLAQQFAGMDTKVASAREYGTGSAGKNRTMRPNAPAKPAEPVNPKAPEAPAVPNYLTAR